jgi:hypothetical protein
LIRQNQETPSRGDFYPRLVSAQTGYRFLLRRPILFIQTICIDESAWAAHHGHGDFLGKCNATCTAREDKFLSNDVNASSLILYPNPSEGTFKVEFSSANYDEEATLDVVNMIGQKVYAQQIKLTEGELQSEIRLENQLAGMYLVKGDCERASCHDTDSSLRITL